MGTLEGIVDGHVREADAVPPAKRALRAVAGLASGGVVVGFASWWMDIRPADVAHAIARTPPLMAAGCVASSFVVFGLQTLRWHTVMRPVLGLRYGEAYRAQIVGMMFNAILPARGGDLLRVQYLGRQTGKSRATILGTEFVDRWLDWFGWIPVMLGLAATVGMPGWIFTVLAVFVAILVALGGFLFAVGRLGKEPKPGSRAAGVYAHFRHGVRVFGSRRTLEIALAVAPLPWLWEGTVLLWSTRAFGMHLSPAQAFTVLIGLNIGMLVPSPGALGALETGGATTLALCGVDKSAAMAFVFAYHLTQLVPGLVTGATILVTQGEKLFGGSRAPAPERMP